MQRIHLSLLGSDVASTGFKTKKRIYDVLENRVFTFHYLQSLGQQESQHPGRGKFSSAPSVIAHLLDLSYPDQSIRVSC